ncbi:pentatricopeptide repeat-containing protein [Gigaspora margarita]|uniref:Pentatricopeptide repeat-containing protein n=1 Tax=Gigaspora margarita TaxID=4874 RepID=A0A8H4AC94_GIGMA|nr:pentatricopeptide repeat-containing protein [Gigaspora margarita]
MNSYLKQLNRTLEIPFISSQNLKFVRPRITEFDSRSHYLLDSSKKKNLWKFTSEKPKIITNLLTPINETQNIKDDLLKMITKSFKYIDNANIAKAWDLYIKLEGHRLLNNSPIKFQQQLLKHYIKRSDMQKVKILIKNLKLRNRNEIWLRYLTVMEHISNFDINEAIKLFGELISTNKEIPKDSMLNMLVALVCHSDVKAIDEVFIFAEKWAEKLYCPSAVEIYNTLISGCVKRKDFKSAYSILEIMRRKNLQPSHVTYNILINLCAKLEKKKEAEGLFRDMLEANIQPNVRTYSSLFEVCGKVKDIASIEYYFKHMSQRGVKPNHHTYSILITAYGRAGLCKEASRWFYHMVVISNLSPNLITYTSLMVAWMQKNGVNEKVVDRIFKDIKKAGIEPDVIAYTALITAKARCQKYTEAVRVYQEMLSNNIKPTVVTYSALIDASVTLGDLGTSLRLFDDMKKTDIVPNEYIYCSIMNAYINQRMLSKAFDTYRTMLSQGVKPDTTCINCLMDACNRERQIDRVFELYNNLAKDPNLEPDEHTFTIFLDSCAYNGRVNEGKTFFTNLVNNYYPLSERNFYAYINLLGINHYGHEIIDAIRLMKIRRVKPSRITVLTSINYIYDSEQVDHFYLMKNILEGWVDKDVIPRWQQIIQFRRRHR